MQFELVFKRGMLCQLPRLPYLFLGESDYKECERIFGQFEINSETVLMAQSSGAGFLLKYLALNHEIKAGQLVLVAPWTDPEKTDASGFYDFSLDSDLPKRIGQIDLFYSKNEENEVLKTVDQLAAVYPGMIKHELNYNGHFGSSNTGYEQPELLEVIK